jgi:hypothetical protein
MTGGGHLAADMRRFWNLRNRNQEKNLSADFADYADYFLKTGFFLCFL